MNAIELNYTVDLAKMDESIKTLDRPLYYGDKNAHTVNVTVLRNGEPEDLSDAICIGHIVYEETGSTLTLDGTSSIHGNVASVTLDSESYLTTGRAYIVVQLTKTDFTMTILALYCWIGVGITDIVEVPSTSRLDIPELIRRISRCEEILQDADEAINRADAAAASATAAAAAGVRTDTSTQNLDNTQKNNARTNIGALSYEAQVLTDAQKAQARTNINAAEDVGLEGRVDALHGLVNYGYDTPGSVVHVSAIAINRVGTRLTLNGALGANDAGVRVYCSGNVLITGAGSNPSGRVAITLINGHRYRLRARHVSGTTLNAVSPAFYKSGTYNRIGDDGEVNTFTYTDAAYPNGIYVGLFLTRRNLGINLENYVVELTLEDITGGMEHLPILPGGDGTFVLKCTVLNGIPTYSWVYEEGATTLSMTPMSTPATLTDISEEGETE